ncbi:MAG TPA: von Willebrand factor type A domain-containing protein [Puia sp.]|nr:von Willebrand factor type A domain-containing protein [Puia sp.]
MRYLISAGVAMLMFLMAFSPSQQFKISGFVKDQNGAPVMGATIMEKQSHHAVLSGSDGSFSLQVSSQQVVLIIQLIGYEQQELSLNADDKPVNIVLKVSVQNLNEVVVTGYGVMRRKDITGSVDKVSGGYYKAPPGIYHKNETRFYQGNTNKSQCSDSTVFNTEEYDAIKENPFLTARENPLSTFSIDVDAGSYSNVRRFLQNSELPPAGAVRIEELINYFHYDYPQPVNDDPFSINTEVSACAWSPKHQLVMIGLQGRRIPTENLPASNLVFLIDVSGSMFEPEKLPLVQKTLKMLVDQLREQDRVSLVVYAGNAGLVLPSTPGSEKTKIKDAIDALEAGGSTAGGAGIQLAYKVAKESFITKGNNRIILCTDGDFNVGPSSDSELFEIIDKEKKSGVFLTVLGYGMGNYKDAKMEKLADEGNGNHAYIDNESEAKKVLVNEFGGTLFTIAKDVKLQIEFNPNKVQAYRLIGYENRMLSKEDFNNDNKDAGELGSGHTVTAIYEVIPVGVKDEFSQKTDPLKYQKQEKINLNNSTNELMTIKFRYKKPDGDISKLIVHPVAAWKLTGNGSNNLQFVSAVAEFGMLLRNSSFKQDASFDQAYILAKKSLGDDKEGYRKEFLHLLLDAEKLTRVKAGKEEPALSKVKVLY